MRPTFSWEVWPVEPDSADFRAGRTAPRVASHRATTSSRAPGVTYRGTVYARPVEVLELHICKCGQSQHQCSSCKAWICTASGHAAHVCGGDW